MTKEFIPYEQALALKELGFDEPCIAYYHNHVNYYFVEDVHRGDTTKNSEQILYPTDCAAPMFSQAFRFFREKYYLHSHIKCSCSVNEIYSFDWIIHKVMNAGTKEENFLTDYERTFEEAELACLIKLIQIAKTK